MNHTAAAANSWEIGASIITAFEAGGLSLAVVIFLVWVIRTIIHTIIRRRTPPPEDDCSRISC